MCESDAARLGTKIASRRIRTLRLSRNMLWHVMIDRGWDING
jgi:hypothetical protein